LLLFCRITRRGYLLTFVLIIVWPILSIPAEIFTQSYFAFWVLVSIAWEFGSAITITFLPLFESQDAIGQVFSGMWNYIRCKKGDAAEQYAEEEPLKTVDEPEEAPAAEEPAADPEKGVDDSEPDPEFMAVLSGSATKEETA
jgi:hypothetical protein